MYKKISIFIFTTFLACSFIYADVPLKERLTMYKTIMSCKELAETDSAKALMDRVLPNNNNLLSAFDANELADKMEAVILAKSENVFFPCDELKISEPYCTNWKNLFEKIIPNIK